MANHKSAKKAHVKSVHKNSANRSVLSRIKTFIKKVEEYLCKGGKEVAAETTTAMRKAESEIMKGVAKGVMKKNTASRKVSKLANKVKKQALGEKVESTTKKAAAQPKQKAKTSKKG